MTDFFARLAARAIGDFHSVEPLIPPRFAESRRSVAPQVELSAEVAAEPVEPGAVVPLRQAGVTADSAVRSPARQPERLPSPSAAEPAAAGAADSPPAPGRSAAALPPQPVAEVIARELSEPLASPVPRVHPVPPAGADRWTAEPASASATGWTGDAEPARKSPSTAVGRLRPVEPPLPVDGRSRPTGPDSGPGGAEAPPLDPEQRGTTVPRRQPQEDAGAFGEHSAGGSKARGDVAEDVARALVLPVVITPRAAAPAGRPDVPRTAGVEVEARPVVQITIGRIEVRAVAPSAPPPPHRAPKSDPRLGLGEYLRQRQGSDR